MSLYIIGGLVRREQGIDDLRRALDNIGRRTGVVVGYDVDEEDRDYLAGVLELSSNGVFFTLRDEPESADVTSNWIDAMTAARSLISDRVADITMIGMTDIKSLGFDEFYFDAMRRTRLGECISAIIHDTNAEHGGISIADGASEQEVCLAANECETEILKTMVLTWDCLPNVTYVW